MRLSGINYNIVSKMDTIIINAMCFVLFSAVVFADFRLNSGAVRNRNTGTSLIMMSENLTQIPEGSWDVEVLNLAYNQINHLENRVFLEKNFKHTKKIFICQNQIRNISVDAFKGLKQLRFLDISDNFLTFLDPDTFKGNNKLEKVIIMNNEISFNRLQTFIVSHSVETLMLTNNKITEIYGVTFLGVPNLKRLILSDNELKTLAPYSFKALRKLHYLSLANTGVHKLSESMFIKLPRIIYLENTPLAKRFEPPLRQVTDESVTALLKINEFVY